jgi:hypothetical protein
MAYSAAAERQDTLDAIAVGIDEIAFALAALGAAYEQLDEASGDRLEAELFRPVQVAFGRAQRTHSEFAARHGLAGRSFEQPSPGPPSTRAKGFVDEAADAIRAADAALAGVQDSDTFIEVGDAELRADLSALRELIGPLPGRARELLRGLGR